MTRLVLDQLKLPFPPEFCELWGRSMTLCDAVHKTAGIGNSIRAVYAPICRFAKLVTSSIMYDVASEGR
jgi:hypothetical protein